MRKTRGRWDVRSPEEEGNTNPASQRRLRSNRVENQIPEPEIRCLGQAVHKGFPFRLEGGPVEMPTGARVPVLGVRQRAFFAVQIGVHGHAVRGFEFVYQAVGLGPVAFGIPPESGQSRGEVRWRNFVVKSSPECFYIHPTLLTPSTDGMIPRF